MVTLKNIQYLGQEVGRHEFRGGGVMKNPGCSEGGGSPSNVADKEGGNFFYLLTLLFNCDRVYYNINVIQKTVLIS